MRLLSVQSTDDQFVFSRARVIEKRKTHLFSLEFVDGADSDVENHESSYDATGNVVLGAEA